MGSSIESIVDDITIQYHSCQYRMAAHGGKSKIRHKNMADGVAGYGGN